MLKGLGPGLSDSQESFARWNILFGVGRVCDIVVLIGRHTTKSLLMSKLY